jgi:hypothetical protein
MKFIDKSILCQTFINFEATYQFLGIFKNNWFFSLFHNFFSSKFRVISPFAIDIMFWKYCVIDFQFIPYLGLYNAQDFAQIL